jgi:hypothetical protein
LSPQNSNTADKNENRITANDRRLSALMVMGTIEDFANGIEEQAPVIDEFYTPHLKPEGLNTLEVYKKQLDSIKTHQSLE